MSKALFNWFSSERGDELIDIARKHFALIREVIESLYNMVESNEKGDNIKRVSDFKLIHEKEHEADTIKKGIISMVSKSQMFPEERLDLIDLIRVTDYIADGAYEAGRLLNIVDLREAPDEIRETALEIAKIDRECVETLTECFRSMRSNTRKCIDFTNEVETLEDNVDEIYGASREYIGSLEYSGWSPGMLYLLAGIYENLASVADYCKDTSDIICSIALKNA